MVASWMPLATLFDAKTVLPGRTEGIAEGYFSPFVGSCNSAEPLSALPENPEREGSRGGRYAKLCSQMDEQ